MTETITSLDNQRLKNAVKLRQARARRKQGRTVIDGAREILYALQSDVALNEIFVCRDFVKTDDARAVLEAAASRSTSLTEVTRQVFDKLSFGSRDEGLVAVWDIPSRELNDLPADRTELVLVLEGVEKPGNIGAVFRTADATGATVILAEPRCEPFNPNAIRASLGSVCWAPFAIANNAETLAFLQQHNIQTFAAIVDEATNGGRSSNLWHQQDYRGKAAFVLGSEAEGLSEFWRTSEATPVCLSMDGCVDSLNVSVAAGAFLYEARRQKFQP